VANRLPLHDLHRKAGAVIDAPCGWELPFSYGDPAAEYAAVRAGVGVVDRSLLDVVEVTGRDRAAFLHAMLSNDVKGLASGAGCAAAFLDAHAKVQSLLTVLALEDRVLLIVPPGTGATLIEALDRFLFSEKAYFREVGGTFALFMMAGPSAADVLGRLGGPAPPDTPWAHAEATVAGRTVRLVRGGAETGEVEVWLLASREDGAGLWEALVATALDVLRVEAGTPWPGHDVDDTVLLPEIPCGGLVSHTKGCYLGQEVVVRIRDRGHVNRLLAGLVVDGTTLPRPGAAVVVEDREVGRVTSAVRSFALGAGRRGRERRSRSVTKGATWSRA
jgi:folate-binding protein YgfZ